MDSFIFVLKEDSMPSNMQKKIISFLEGSLSSFLLTLMLSDMNTAIHCIKQKMKKDSFAEKQTIAFKNITKIKSSM